MASITIEFTFENVDGREETAKNEFDLDSCIEDSVQEYQDDYMNDNGLDDDWDCTREEVLEVEIDGDEDADEDMYSNLADLAEYAELVEEHGEAYALRCKDIGDDFKFDDTYNGCHSSEAEFAQNTYEDIYGGDNPLFGYVDWDQYARDLLMDYSVYDGDDGLHIFRDC